MTSAYIWRIPLLASAVIGLFPASMSISQPTVAALLSEAERAESAGKLTEALEEYEAALQSDPRNPRINLRIGLLKGKAGDFAGAETAFKRALELQPNLAEAHYDMGLTILGESKNAPAWAEALKEFQAAVTARPDYVEALNMTGACLLESGGSAAAIEQLRTALEHNEKSAEIHFNLGRALETSGRGSEALHEYSLALQQRKPYPEAETAIGNLLFAKGDIQSAAEHFGAVLVSNPGSEEAHYKLAKILREEGKSQEASLELKQVAALNQERSDAVMSSHLSNESLDRAKAGDLSGAIELGKKALWLNPENAVADYNLGLLLADTGDLESAMLQLRKAISLAPITSAFYISLARVDEKAGNIESAKEALRIALRMNPGNLDLQAKMKAIEALPSPSGSGTASVKLPRAFPFGATADTANEHFAFASELNKEGDILGSIGELLRASKISPDRSDIHYNLAVARTQIGQYDKAELKLRTVLAQSPENVDARVALGSLLFQAKDFTHASAELRKALAVQPGNAAAARLLAQCPVAPSR